MAQGTVKLAAVGLMGMTELDFEIIFFDEGITIVAPVIFADTNDSPRYSVSTESYAFIIDTGSIQHRLSEENLSASGKPVAYAGAYSSYSGGESPMTYTGGDITVNISRNNNGDSAPPLFTGIFGIHNGSGNLTVDSEGENPHNITVTSWNVESGWKSGLNVTDTSGYNGACNFAVIAGLSTAGGDIVNHATVSVKDIDQTTTSWNSGGDTGGGASTFGLTAGLSSLDLDLLSISYKPGSGFIESHGDVTIAKRTYAASGGENSFGRGAKAYGITSGILAGGGFETTGRVTVQEIGVTADVTVDTPNGENNAVVYGMTAGGLALGERDGVAAKAVAKEKVTVDQVTYTAHASGTSYSDAEVTGLTIGLGALSLRELGLTVAYDMYGVEVDAELGIGGGTVEFASVAVTGIQHDAWAGSMDAQLGENNATVTSGVIGAIGLGGVRGSGDGTGKPALSLSELSSNATSLSGDADTMGLTVGATSLGLESLAYATRGQSVTNVKVNSEDFADVSVDGIAITDVRYEAFASTSDPAIGQNHSFFWDTGDNVSGDGSALGITVGALSTGSIGGEITGDIAITSITHAAKSDIRAAEAYGVVVGAAALGARGGYSGEESDTDPILVRVREGDATLGKVTITDVTTRSHVNGTDTTKILTGNNLSTALTGVVGVLATGLAEAESVDIKNIATFSHNQNLYQNPDDDKFERSASSMSVTLGVAGLALEMENPLEILDGKFDWGDLTKIKFKDAGARVTGDFALSNIDSVAVLGVVEGLNDPTPKNMEPILKGLKEQAITAAGVGDADAVNIVLGVVGLGEASVRKDADGYGGDGNLSITSIATVARAPHGDATASGATVGILAGGTIDLEFKNWFHFEFETKDANALVEGDMKIETVLVMAESEALTFAQSNSATALGVTAAAVSTKVLEAGGDVSLKGIDYIAHTKGGRELLEDPTDPDDPWTAASAFGVTSGLMAVGVGIDMDLDIYLDPDIAPSLDLNIKTDTSITAAGGLSLKEITYEATHEGAVYREDYAGGEFYKLLYRGGEASAVGVTSGALSLGDIEVGNNGGVSVALSGIRHVATAEGSGILFIIQTDGYPTVTDFEPNDASTMGVVSGLMAAGVDFTWSPMNLVIDGNITTTGGISITDVEFTATAKEFSGEFSYDGEDHALNLRGGDASVLGITSGALSLGPIDVGGGVKMGGIWHIASSEGGGTKATGVVAGLSNLNFLPVQKAIAGDDAPGIRFGGEGVAISGVRYSAVSTAIQTEFALPDDLAKEFTDYGIIADDNNASSADAMAVGVTSAVVSIGGRVESEEGGITISDITHKAWSGDGYSETLGVVSGVIGADVASLVGGRAVSPDAKRRDEVRLGGDLTIAGVRFTAESETRTRYDLASDDLDSYSQGFLDVLGGDATTVGVAAGVVQFGNIDVAGVSIDYAVKDEDGRPVGGPSHLAATQGKSITWPDPFVADLGYMEVTDNDATAVGVSIGLASLDLDVFNNLGVLTQLDTLSLDTLTKANLGATLLGLAVGGVDLSSLGDLDDLGGVNAGGAVAISGLAIEAEAAEDTLQFTFREKEPIGYKASVSGGDALSVGVTLGAVSLNDIAINDGEDEGLTIKDFTQAAVSAGGDAASIGVLFGMTSINPSTAEEPEATYFRGNTDIRNITFQARVVEPTLPFSLPDAVANVITNYDEVKAEISARGDATVFGMVTGGFGMGNVEAEGDVAISGITYSAANAAAADQGLDAVATGFTVGLTGLGYMKARGDVTITDVTHTASGQDGVLAAGMVSGVFGFGGYAAAFDNEITVEASGAALADKDGESLGMVHASGMWAPYAYVFGSSIDVLVTDDRSLENGRLDYGLAVGVMGDEEILLAAYPPAVDAIPVSPEITATGHTYAYALATDTGRGDDVYGDPDGFAHTTEIFGPVLLSATSKLDGVNDHTESDLWKEDNTYVRMTGFILNDTPMPVKEAEYLGLGTDDVANLYIGVGQVMDNDERAIRFFGAEEVNIKNGTLKMVKDSYFVNQVDFDYDLDKKGVYGEVLVPHNVRTTAVTVEEGATLEIAGHIVHTLTFENDGAHQTRFSIAASQGERTGDAFVLNTDYYLDLVVAENGALTYYLPEEVFTDKELADIAMLHVTTANLDGGTLGLAEDFETVRFAYMPLDSTVKIHLLEAWGSDDDKFVENYVPEQDVNLLFYSYKFTTENHSGLADTITDVYIEAYRNGNTIGNQTALMCNPNNRALGISLDPLPLEDYLGTEFGDLVLRPIYESEDFGQFARRIDQLHPEPQATTIDIVGRQYQLFNGFINNLIVDRPSPEETFLTNPTGCRFDVGTPWGIRVRLTGDYARRDAGCYNDFDVKGYNAMLALERIFSSSFSLGLAADIGHTKIDFDRHGAKSRSDDYGVGLYARYCLDNLFLAGRVGFGYSDIDTTRHFRDFDLPSAKSDYHATHYAASLLFGYEFLFANRWALVPTVELSYLRTKGGSITEQGGGPAAMRIKGDHKNSLEALANIEVKRSFRTGGGKIVAPRANLGIGQELADNNYQTRYNLAHDAGMAWTKVESASVGRTRFTFGAGVDAFFTKNFGVALDYQGSVRKHYVEHLGQVSFKVIW